MAVKINRTNAIGERLCSQRACPVVINQRHLMCPKHWNEVPKSVRLQTWAALRAFENDPGSAEKLTALRRLQGEAIDWVSP